MYFFKEIGVDLNLKDNSGTSALQWAVFSSAEVSASYLLSWSPDFDHRNDAGQTALHVAVTSADESESVRCIRFLLLRGADKEIVDNNGLKAIDYCDKIEDAKLKSEALKMLEKPSVMDFLMLSPPTRKMRKSSFTMIIFLTLFFGCILVQIFFTFPHLGSVAIGCNILATTICIVCLFLTSCRQPGFIKP